MTPRGTAHFFCLNVAMFTDLLVSKDLLMLCRGSSESSPGSYPQAVEVVTWESLGCQVCPSLEMGFVKSVSLGAQRSAAACPAVPVTGSAISRKPLETSRPQFTHLYKKGANSAAEQVW